ncbi:hypothetical protein PPL_03806 [Heterostelium album PN500]|uniref:Uncharacterized protein n=1 Tax=Heterostelium pallidum (strain ATCC 26659 / Pp 5 / PN500) TaxID=670386 RepID=D3B6Q3_HETP5|nr:hypothetical protein PPL_03806 [Heterostelium album PN500]EFA83023.1 hypothetical protein PPL_03806 [Heterostelium album PN500]|eukprot:XP_020435140.1 hypothetical protein PPL_03806 [Heterostelium album PN500]
MIYQIFHIVQRSGIYRGPKCVKQSYCKQSTFALSRVVAAECPPALWSIFHGRRLLSAALRKEIMINFKGEPTDDYQTCLALRLENFFWDKFPKTKTIIQILFPARGRWHHLWIFDNHSNDTLAKWLRRLTRNQFPSGAQVRILQVSTTLNHSWFACGDALLSLLS